MAWFFIRRYVDRAEFTATTCSHVVNRPRWFQVPIYPTWLSLLGTGPHVAAPVTETASPSGL